MTEERLVIQPPVERSHRFGGLLLLGMISLMFSLFGWTLMLSTPRVKIYEFTQVLFIGAVLLVSLAVAIGLGARMAFETQIWIVGRDYFERRSTMLIWSWSKIYQATAWRLERLGHNGTYYVLSPVGARVGMLFTPFWMSSQPRQALDLGRQLARHRLAASPFNRNAAA